MRIISGKARGTKLYTLEGTHTRPTLDRVKESLFNIIQNDLVDSTFLDLFSGSGAIGLEAASRGAKKVILCDKHKPAINYIARNIEKTHMKEKVKVYAMDFKEVLNNKITERLDFIYIDPPYKTRFAYEALKIILEKEYADENTKIIIETDEEEQFLKDIYNLNVQITDKRKYGRASIIFLRKEG